MKKIVVLGMLVILLFTLCACSDKLEVSNSMVSTTAEQGTTAEPGATAEQGTTAERASTSGQVVQTTVTALKFKDLKTSDEINEDSQQPKNPKSTFSTTTPMIYLSGSFYNAKPDQELMATYLYLESSPATEINSYAFIIGIDNTSFYFNEPMPTNGWLKGKYEIRLFIDGEYAETVPFEVK